MFQPRCVSAWKRSRTVSPNEISLAGFTPTRNPVQLAIARPGRYLPWRTGEEETGERRGPEIDGRPRFPAQNDTIFEIETRAWYTDTFNVARSQPPPPPLLPPYALYGG